MTHTDQAMACVLLDQAIELIAEPMSEGERPSYDDCLLLILGLREIRKHITDDSKETVAWSA